jgi:predicted dehydrogenase
MRLVCLQEKLMDKRKYSVGIVGLGNIGFSYDHEQAPELARTHARAVTKESRTELAWGVDKEQGVRRAFEKTCGVHAYSDLATALSKQSVDIVVLAVSVEQRSDLWSLALEANPKLIISEKPLAGTLEAADKIIDACKSAGTELLVNYPRRYSPATSRAKQLIASGKLGKFQTGHVWYGKGVANNASHLINLLVHILDVDWSVTDVGRAKTNYPNGDIDASFRLSHASSSIDFTPLDSTIFSHAEIDLMFDLGRLRFMNHGYGLIEQVGLVSSSFAGYNELSPDVEVVGSGIDTYQLDVISYAVDGLANSVRFTRDVDDAISTARIVDQILKQSR